MYLSYPGTSLREVTYQVDQAGRDFSSLFRALDMSVRNSQRQQGEGRCLGVHRLNAFPL